MKRVIIIGAGFAGLNAAKVLANKPGIEVFVIDQKNHHLFQPLLYQVATAGLNPADIAVPIRAQFAKDQNISVYLGRVESINLAEKWLKNNGEKVHFDFLIIACGAQHSYFGKSEWEMFAPGLKTLEQATEIRRRILSSFEYAENESDVRRQKALLTFCVVGGGPTGVELAGAIADISQTVLKKDFRRINSQSARVVLVEAGPRILPMFHPDLSAKARKGLERLGVEVRTSMMVMNVDAGGISTDRETISAATVIWAAGVQANALSKTLGVDLDRAGRIKVQSDLSIAGNPDVYVVGDIANFMTDKGLILPGLAPVAIQQGKRAARNIMNRLKGLPSKPFVYKDKGQMATIGRWHAIVEAGDLRFDGLLAWIVWLFIHIFYLVGFRNRVSVFFSWSWNYLFSKRGSRLITDRNWRLYSVDRQESLTPLLTDWGETKIDRDLKNQSTKRTPQHELNL